MTTKELVLSILAQQKGSIISGEELAKRANVSRTGIWKAIKSLEKEGYEIEANSGVGYCLNEASDVLSKIGIVNELEDKYKGNDIFVLKETTSTNADALKMIVDGAKHGTLIVTDKQTAGRGRIGKDFVSPLGGVYFSIILDMHNCPIQNATIITPAAAVAVSKSISQLTGIENKIKWVNDIYVGGKKVCGILTQASTDIETGLANYIVIGIGINFKTKMEEFPNDLQDKVTSLFLNSDINTTRNKLVASIYTKLLEYTSDISNRDFMKDYKELSLAIGKDISYIKNGNEYLVKCVDVDINGGLVVMNDGVKETLTCGEVSIKSENGWL